MYLILKLFSSIELLTFLVLLKLQATYFMLYFCWLGPPFSTHSQVVYVSYFCLDQVPQTEPVGILIGISFNL